MQDLLAPALDHLKPWPFDLFDILLQAAPCDQLSNEYDLLSLIVIPGRNEVNDILMIQFLDQVNLRLYPKSVSFRKPVQTYEVPSDLHAGLIVHSFVNDLVCSSPKLFAESLESTFGRYLHDDVIRTNHPVFIFPFFEFSLFLLMLTLISLAFHSSSILFVDTVKVRFILV